MRINHNSVAYTANHNLSAANQRLADSVERLSSGYKINSSKDDAAGMAISQKMQAQIDGLNQATQNSNDGISLIQTAEGTLGEIQSMLTRMEELATQAANDPNDLQDRASIQEEIDNLIAELDRITQDMDFNGRKLLNGDVTRRSYTDNTNLKVFDISSTVEEGDYGITVTADAEQAKASGLGLATTYTFSELEAGILSVNGIEIEVKAGMTMEQVYSDLVYYSGYAGVDAFADDGTGQEVPFNLATKLTFRTQEYGSKQYIKIGCENDNLANVLGINGIVNQTFTGKDAVADFMTDATGKRIGFENTATMQIDGNRITVTDKNNFEMQFKTTPGAVANGGAYESTARVLSAGPINLQIGAFEGEHLLVNIPKVNSETLNLEHVSIFTHDLASQALDKIQAASKKISSIRSYLGACQNRLDYTTTNLETTSENMTSALSGILDTDMAEQMTVYTQQQVLTQSAIQMLSKANALPENLLQLIQTN